MRSNRLLALPLFVLLVLTGIVPALAQTPPPAPPLDELGNRQGVSVAPLAKSSAAAEADPNILCFTTRTGSVDPCARVGSLFASVTTVRSIDAVPADLSPYQLFFLGYGEGTLLNSRSAQLIAYVQGGGGLIVEQPNLAGRVDVYPPGFEMTVTDITWPGFPGDPPPTEFTSAGASHPILSGLSPVDLSGNFDIVPLSTLGPGWTILAKSAAHPHLALAVGTYGTGRIAFTSSNISAASIDGGSDAFVRQLIQWAGTPAANGPDMRITAIEVTQAIQDLNNSVELIAGKRTYVRVHVSAPVLVTNVTANLSGSRGVTRLYPTLSPGNPAGRISIRTAPDRGQINDSFWFELPYSWIGAGNLTLSARIDPSNAKNDSNLANNSSSVTVNFLQAAPLRLRLYNVRYTVGGTTHQADGVHLTRLESWLRRAYPISSLVVTRDTFNYGSGLPNVDLLNARLGFVRLLRILFSGENSRTVYYGLVDDGGGFMRGKAAGIPGTVASGPTGTPSGGLAWDTDGSYGDWYGGHEIAHTRNRYHAEFCGATGGRSYPYAGGRISPALTGATAIYGFDILNRRIYDPNWKDVMTYCQNQWISDFTYEGIRSYMSSLGVSVASNTTMASNTFVLVSGLVYLDTKTGALDTVNVIQQANQLPLPTPGDWTIVLVGPGGDLASYPFMPQELTDAESSPGRPATVAEIVPWVDGATRLELRYGSQVVDARNASANAPVVTITAPQTGQQVGDGPLTISWTGSDADNDPLTYSVLYSHDGGVDWTPLTTAFVGQQFSIETSQLAGGTTSRIRVIASDGLRSGVATTGNFTVPTKAPEVQITAPAANATFFPAQQVVFEGSAYDREDGELSGASLVWSSSKDGQLGTGSIVSTVNLTTGTHEITLVATDSDGRTQQAKRTIVVLEGSAAPAAELTAAPDVIGVTLPFGGAAVNTTVTLRNSSETALGWSAGDDAPWVTLSSSSGTTPADLVVTIDPAGLTPGDYQAVITMTTSAGTTTVPVTLTVTGSSRFLPLVQR
jgi:hypothetical protein